MRGLVPKARALVRLWPVALVCFGAVELLRGIGMVSHAAEAMVLGLAMLAVGIGIIYLRGSE